MQINVTHICWKITQRYYPTGCANLNRGDIVTDWNKKIPTAIFRGSATGCGITPETNQRLKVAELSEIWSKDNNYNKNNKIDGIPYLNAGVVGWNRRDKKFIGKPVDIINTSRLNFKKLDFTNESANKS